MSSGLSKQPHQDPKTTTPQDYYPRAMEYVEYGEEGGLDYNCECHGMDSPPPPPPPPLGLVEYISRPSAKTMSRKIAVDRGIT